MSTPDPPLDPSHAAAPPADASATAAAAAGPRPYWVPAGVDLNDFPLELQAAIAGVINPDYEVLVLKAAPGPCRTTGISIMHLLWLEILDQIELGLLFPAGRLLDSGARELRAATLSRHLRLVQSKFNATDLLLRLEKFRHARGSWNDPWRPAAPPIPMPPASPDHGNSKFC